MKLDLNWKIQKSLQKWHMKVLYFRERFDLVDSPSEYYIIVSFLDLVEYVFHLNNMQVFGIG